MWKVLEELSVLGAMEGKVMAPWTVKGMEKSHTASFSVPYNSAFSLCPKDPNPAGFVKKKKKMKNVPLLLQDVLSAELLGEADVPQRSKLTWTY